jgi:cytochrome P450
MNALLKIQDFDDPNFDPFIADEIITGTLADIYTPLADKLRNEGPVIEANLLDLWGIPHGFNKPGMRNFTVLGYEHVTALLSDVATFTQEAFADSLVKTFGWTISAMDPPEHTRYRRLFQKAFLPQTVAQWSETLVDPVIDELMGQFKGRTEADLVTEFTATYPFRIIYKQLGLPPSEGAIFHRLAVAQNLIINDELHAVEASRKLGAYFTALIAARRKNPSDDLASALINTTVDGETLPDKVIMSFLRQLINAAGDTTVRGTSVFLLGLLQNPDQLDALRRDRGLMPQAIEEALRWEGPISWTARHCAHDTELAGVTVPKGSRMYVGMASANRDAGRFPNPDKFDIFRARTHRNIAFAVGPHICLGQHLARLEMSRAVSAILDRLPNLRLDPDKPAPIVRGMNLRMPRHLHVRFDKA